jgi:hypothetical protein
VHLDLLGELEVRGDLGREIPVADEPVVGFPGLIGHPFTPPAWADWALFGRYFSEPGDQSKLIAFAI